MKIKKSNSIKKQVKKHVGDISIKEMDLLKSKFKEVGEWVPTDHFYEEVERKGCVVTEKHIRDMIRLGEVVEYEQNIYPSGFFSELVVMSMAKREQNSIDPTDTRITMVFNLTDGVIVTLWESDINKSYRNLTNPKYRSSLKVGVKYIG